MPALMRLPAVVGAEQEGGSGRGGPCCCLRERDGAHEHTSPCLLPVFQFLSLTASLAPIVFVVFCAAAASESHFSHLRTAF